MRLFTNTELIENIIKYFFCKCPVNPNNAAKLLSGDMQIRRDEFMRKTRLDGCVGPFQAVCRGLQRLLMAGRADNGAPADAAAPLGQQPADCVLELIAARALRGGR